MYYNVNYTIICIQLCYGNETDILFAQDILHVEVKLFSLCYMFEVQIYKSEG
jgi:hypothetical protein